MRTGPSVRSSTTTYTLFVDVQVVRGIRRDVLAQRVSASLRSAQNLRRAHPKAVGVAQRVIEMLIGRLITDEQFRTEFLGNPRQTLERLSDSGFELSQTEITALLGTDSALWERAADALDPRLQKASLKNGPGHSRP